MAEDLRWVTLNVRVSRPDGWIDFKVPVKVHPIDAAMLAEGEIALSASAPDAEAGERSLRATIEALMPKIAWFRGCWRIDRHPAVQHDVSVLMERLQALIAVPASAPADAREAGRERRVIRAATAVVGMWLNDARTFEMGREAHQHVELIAAVRAFYADARPAAAEPEVPLPQRPKDWPPPVGTEWWTRVRYMGRGKPRVIVDPDFEFEDEPAAAEPEAPRPESES